MPELLTLTVPVIPPTISTYGVVYLAFDWDNQSITVGLKGTNGERINFSYAGATATTLMVALNKANLSTISLQKRVIQQLIADGKLSGVISGAPD